MTALVVVISAFVIERDLMKYSSGCGG